MSKTRWLVGALCAAAVSSAAGPVLAYPPAARPSAEPQDYAKLQGKAEAFYREGAYARAHKLYRQASELRLGPDEARWVAFRVADTGWRGTSAPDADRAVLETMQRQLEALAAPSAGEPDRISAEAHESLGDLFWTRLNVRDWSSAWPHYQAALQWWAGARDVELARRRYLDIVWRSASVNEADPWSWYAGHLPLEVVENARRIAREPADRGQAHLLLAMRLRHADWTQRRRIEQEFEAAIALGNSSPWYDDALHRCAEWLAAEGRVTMTDGGQYRQEPDFAGAVALYHRLLEEFDRGATRYWDEAKRQVEAITEPQLGLAVSEIFLPGSEIQFDLSWRNVRGVDLALHKVDLTRDLDPTRQHQHVGGWVAHLQPGTGSRAKEWTFDTKDTGRHAWGHERLRLDERLPTGAYLLVASGGGRTMRELVLVSDLTLVVKSWGEQALAWVCNVADGAPVSGARVRLWNYLYDNQRWVGADWLGRSDQDGLFRFDARPAPGGRAGSQGYLVTASVNGRQAFAVTWPGQGREAGGSWRIYAATDRPAYRPGESVAWKVTARVDGADGYRTPSGASLRYEISGPRSKAAGGEMALNTFGSAWGELELAEAMALGEYRIDFFMKDGRHLGSTPLFRLEEYKLPEFEVTVRTTAAGPGGYRLGETVEGVVEAGYYFGAPAADAEVELLVYQRPFQHFWVEERDYPWYYQNRADGATWAGGGQVVERQSLRTDGAGRAAFFLHTPPAASWDLEYTIEARVTDASRRLVTAARTLRVTRQAFYVHPKPRRNVYAPQEQVQFDVRTVDAQGDPVPARGLATVSRLRWVEIWLDPQGREVSGTALGEARRKHATFPPAPRPGEAGWTHKYSGYSEQEVLTKAVQGDAKGGALVEFTPAEAGYYRLSWSSVDPAGPGETPIRAETFVWVAEGPTVELGYRQGGLQIIPDRDTYRAGETARVLVAVDSPGRHVLFSVEGDDLYDWRMFRAAGTALLLEVPVEKAHCPNVSFQALSVAGGRLLADQREIIVPPVHEFLTVEVRADREMYGPQEEGSLTVVTRDAQGAPVQAEVSLALADESVQAIQGDYAADPRAFFHGDRQALRVRTDSTLNQKRYARLAGAAEGAGAAGREDDGEFKEENERLGHAMRQQRDNMVPGPVAEAAMDFDGAGARAPSVRKSQEGAAGMAGAPAVVVRTDFRSTVFWQPDLVTGPDGTATVRVRYPDALTRWRATARAATTGSRFGMAEAATRTRRALVARLQAPRFFVVGDSVSLSAVLNNNTGAPMAVRPALEVEGLKLVAVMRGGRRAGAAEPLPPVDVPAGGSARIDWIAAVEQPGEARVKLVAQGREHADAVERTFAVHEHGIEKLLSRSGKLDGDRVTVKLEIPPHRKDSSAQLAVSVTPSLAVTMLDALPYLVQYPYGCTEQTMSRFLPAVITAKALRELGLSPQEGLGRVFGNTAGTGRGSATGAAGAKGGEASNLLALHLIVQQGLERLYDFQHADGGWGWWKEGESDPFMSAYVLWGMCLAREAGTEVRAEVVDRAARFVEGRLVAVEASADLQAWLLHAAATHHRLSGGKPVLALQSALETLWQKRDRLDSATRALAAMSAHLLGHKERAAALCRGLENGVARDERPDESVLLGSGAGAKPAAMATARWGASGSWRRWSEGPVEATSMALRALLAITPDHELVEPAATWLIRNRRGARWSNTRDTTMAILALCDYLRRSRELESGFEYEILVNGTPVARDEVTAMEMLSAPARHLVPPERVREGANTIEIVRRSGRGPIYFSAEARLFTLEEPIEAAGNELFVRRDYLKLVGRETLLRGVVYDRMPLEDGDYLTSGERVQVVLTVEVKNDGEYLVFEDLKPAGFEAVKLRSGEPLQARQLTAEAAQRRFGGELAREAEGLNAGEAVVRESDYAGRTRGVHQELRDRKVALFVDRLEQGYWEVRYELRAEVPGQFHALPVVGHAMYVPDIRANSREMRLTVNDRETAAAFATGE